MLFFFRQSLGLALHSMSKISASSAFSLCSKGFGLCRKMKRYQKLGYDNIGTQSGSAKFIYHDSETGKIVAFHSLYLKPGGDSDGIEIMVPLMTIREVSIQKEMDNENVASLIDIEYEQDDGLVHLVFEYPGMNLTRFIQKSPEKVSDPTAIKKLLHQLLSGTCYYHSVKAAHGNLNANNVVIDPYKDHLKITNFPLDENEACYKAPEILLGSEKLTPASDMFAVGCLFGEMLAKKPLFLSLGGAAKRKSIFNLLGTPTEDSWPGVSEKFEKLSDHEKCDPKDLKEVFLGLEDNGIDLLSKLLCVDPSKRITSSDSLKHPYFEDVRDM